MLKLGLLLVMLHALHEAHSHHKVHEGIDIISPEQVHATRGSCLVIPCSYTFPKAPRPVKSYHGLWKKDSRWVDAATSWANDPIHKDYNGRTRFLGQVQKKNCTWMLTGVRDSDAGQYYFRIEMAGYDSYSWSIANTKVQVVDAKYPDFSHSAPSARGDVVVHCSVTHSCPYYPPTLTWNHNGTVLSGSYQVSDWQWMTYSTLKLRLQQNNTVQEICCTATYYGGQKLHSAVRYY